VIERGGELPDWVRLSDHPVIVRTCRGTTGGMSLEGASPHLIGDDRDLFLDALRRDLSVCSVEKAKPIFRRVPVGPECDELQPETCTPYTDANACGYYLKNTLPLVFVRTNRGEVLPNARVALKYLRENAGRFADVLERIAGWAERVFRPDAYAALRASRPLLVADVAQPYSSFTNTYMAMGAGCYAMTPPGVATLLGPPINQPPPLRLHTGLMGSEWHHSELFVVFDCPEFDEQVLVIEPDTVLAQFYFVAQADDTTEIVFEEEHAGADPAYRERSIQVGLEQLRRQQEFFIARATGVKSLSVACPHCWVSVTNAAENGVPDSHIAEQDFYRGYKALAAEYHRARNAERPR
jgi:hypothetical protein